MVSYQESKICPTCKTKFYRKDYSQLYYTTKKGLSNHHWRLKKYCSKKCQANYSQSRRRKEKPLIILKTKQKFKKKYPYYYKERYRKIKQNPELYKKLKEDRKRLYYKNRENNLKRTKEWYAKRRKMVFEHYNNKCAMCGYNEHLGVLDIHHIDNDKKHKRDIHKKQRLMLLCPNCHTKHNRGIITKIELLKFYKPFKNGK